MNLIDYIRIWKFQNSQIHSLFSWQGIKNLWQNLSNWKANHRLLDDINAVSFADPQYAALRQEIMADINSKMQATEHLTKIFDKASVLQKIAELGLEPTTLIAYDKKQTECMIILNQDFKISRSSKLLSNVSQIPNLDDNCEFYFV